MSQAEKDILIESILSNQVDFGKKLDEMNGRLIAIEINNKIRDERQKSQVGILTAAIIALIGGLGTTIWGWVMAVIGAHPQVK